jgi:RNase P subunit RPR2
MKNETTIKLTKDISKGGIRFNNDGQYIVFKCSLCEDGERLVLNQTCPKCGNNEGKYNQYDNCIGCKTPVCYGEDFELAMNEKGLPICPDCQKREPFNIYKTCNQIIDEHEHMTFFLETGEVKKDKSKDSLDGTAHMLNSRDKIKFKEKE